eukprot:TRINITY_DN38600_c2_g1_i1.p1 TRINITY_DN38600_c2_g1~~TRINITY_DN38600_c2_g1_i1.p1  ORF type:complete len:127 (+),score=4.69 TRINITY_DN38600_c2_g1_i1:220-600(+)
MPPCSNLKPGVPLIPCQVRLTNTSQKLKLLGSGRPICLKVCASKSNRSCLAKLAINCWEGFGLFQKSILSRYLCIFWSQICAVYPNLHWIIPYDGTVDSILLGVWLRLLKAHLGPNKCLIRLQFEY